MLQSDCDFITQKFNSDKLKFLLKKEKLAIFVQLNTIILFIFKHLLANFSSECTRC